MAVLVDEARWPWKGQLWAHLVSDESYDELHEAARRIGKRRLSFQGDHYDVHMVDRERALTGGAEAIDSRTLVRRLRGSGLRRAGAKPDWVRIGQWPHGVSLAEMERSLTNHGLAGRRLGDGLQSLDGRLADVGVAIFSDDTHLVGLLEIAADVPCADVAALAELSDQLCGRVDRVVVGEPRVGGDRSIELFVAK